MKNRWMTVLLIFSLAVNIAAVATLTYFWRQNQLPAVPPPPGMARQPLERPLPPWRNLDLPPASRKELFELRRQFHAQIVELRRAADESRWQLMHQLMQPNIDKDSLNASLQTLTAKQMEMERMTVNHLLELRSHLTNEQWQMLLRSMERERRGMQRSPFARKARPFITPE